MKTKNLRHITLGLLAALALAGGGITQVHALTVTCPVNKTNECLPVFDYPYGTNGCCTNITINVVTNFSSTSECYSTFTRVWLVSDCCTNETCSQTIAVVDTTPPVFSYCPPNQTVSCGTNWGFGTPTAYDTCCASNPVITIISTTTNLNDCPATYERIWRAMDCCFNSVTCTQIVSVVDTTPPVITCASNKTIGCGASLTFDPPTAVDACCPSNSLQPQFIGSFMVSSNACQKSWAGLWQVSDCCSNYSGICTQLVTVVDSFAPAIFCPNTNLVLNCTGANGRIVDFLVTATDDCDPNPTVTCTPPSGSFFFVGTTTVTCRAKDACGRISECVFTVTIQDNCPSNSCISLTCPDDIRLPCDNVGGTVVNWTWAATNTCVSSNLLTWSDPPSGTLFGSGTYTITCYASNTLGGELRTCQFTVEIFPESPALLGHFEPSLPGFGRRLALDWRVACGEFGIEVNPRFGSGGAGGDSGWSPIGGVPFAHWTRPNNTNNAIDRFLSADIPLPVGDPMPDAMFFRLTSNPGKEKDFSSLPTGTYAENPALPGTWITFSIPGGTQMQIVDFNNTHALEVDAAGIVADFPANPATWPQVLSGPPAFHEAELRVVGYGNGPNPCWFAEAFDTAGRLVDAHMTTNGTVTLRSSGFPLDHVKVFTEPNESAGLVSIKGRTGHTLAIDLPADCLDFRNMPTGAVANPWLLPGHTITATNSLGEPTSASIEAGPDAYGNGYHVEYAATIQLTTNCCRHILVELIKHAGPVQVVAYGDSGTELASRVVTESGTPVTVVFRPSSAPICKVVVTAPDDQTRILSICCLPALQPVTPPTIPPPGTNANPLVAGPVTFRVSGGLLGQFYTFTFQHNFFPLHSVLDLGTETEATLATPFNKVVVEVISENPNSGMELEAADEFGFVVSRGGPLTSYAGPQTVVLAGPGIKTVRFKCPSGQGSLANFYLLPQ